MKKRAVKGKPHRKGKVKDLTPKDLKAVKGGVSSRKSGEGQKDFS